MTPKSTTLFEMMSVSQHSISCAEQNLKAMKTSVDSLPPGIFKFMPGSGRRRREDKATLKIYIQIYATILEFKKIQEPYSELTTFLPSFCYPFTTPFTPLRLTTVCFK